MSPKKNIIKVKVETENKDNEISEKTVKKIGLKKETAIKRKPKAKTRTKKTSTKKTASKIKRADVKKTPKKTIIKKPKSKQKITVVDEEEQEKNIELGLKENENNNDIKEKAATVTSAIDQTNDYVKKIVTEEEKNNKEEADKTKKIESKSALDNVQENDVKEIPLRPHRSVAMYRRIAFSFIFLTLALIAVVAYFLLIKVTVVIVPNQERISNNIIFDVKSPEKISGGGNIVPGLVEKNNFSLDSTYPSSGEEVVGKEAIGEAVIINNYNRNQPLVATTRILAASGELFRLKNTVNVPAGESITVEIYADEPSPEMAIEATKFSIPGLWAGLQDKIYAETKSPIVYQQKVNKYVLESDIEGSIRDLKQKLLFSAKEEIESKYEEYKQVKYKIDENSIKTSINAKTGEKINEFTASITADIVVVAFDEKAAADLAKQKFVSSLSPNKEVIDFNDTEIIYSLNNFDYLANEATINATFEGIVSFRDNAKVIDTEKIKGLNQAQLNTYLEQIKDIAGYEIIFNPSFLPNFLKRVPKLSDRIEIRINK
jgi:hypothetical protein